MKPRPLRVELAACDAAYERALRIEFAEHDPYAGDRQQWFQPPRPHLVLERSFSDYADTAVEQERQRGEECVGRVKLDVPTRLAGMADRTHEAFFNLIAAESRTVHLARESVGERRLAGAGGTSHDDQRRLPYITHFVALSHPLLVQKSGLPKCVTVETDSTTFHRRQAVHFRTQL